MRQPDGRDGPPQPAQWWREPRDHRIPDDSGRHLRAGGGHVRGHQVGQPRVVDRGTLLAPAGGLGFWQGALRDPSEPVYAGFAGAAKNREPVTIEVLYTDMDGGQRAITRMGVLPGQGDRWVAAVSRHWMLDGQVTGGRGRARDAAARR